MNAEPERIDWDQRWAAVEHAQRNVPDRHPLAAHDIEDVPGPDLETRQLQLWSDIVPSRFIGAELADLNGDSGISPDAYAELCDWAVSPARRNLVLFGAIGTGKTHAAVAAVRPSHFRGIDCRFVPSVELLDLLRPPNPASLLYDLAAVSILVVDDLGTQRDSEWTDERLYALLNRRWLEELPTVVTTNVPHQQMEERFGPRLFSRLRHGAVGVELVGRDRRAPT